MTYEFYLSLIKKEGMKKEVLSEGNIKCYV